MRSIKTFMAIVLAIIIASLTFPALAEDAASTFDVPTEMACPLVTSPDQSADVLAQAVIHRMSVTTPVTDYPGELMASTETSVELPFGGADGHTATTGIRAWQT